LPLKTALYELRVWYLLKELKMTKNQNIKEFNYIHFKLSDLFYKARYLILMGVTTLIGGVTTGAPIDWILVIVFALIVLVVSLYLKYKEENGFPTFKVSDESIEIEYRNQTKYYLLTEVKRIEKIDSKYGREKRLGFNVILKSEEQYIVLQRINGYVKLYEYFKKNNIPGTLKLIVIHDNVDEFGITID